MPVFRDVMLIPKMSGKLSIEQMEAIQQQLRQFERLMGGEQRLYLTSGWGGGDATETAKAKKAADFFNRNRSTWEGMSVGDGGPSGFKYYSSGLEFPNGQMVGTGTFDDTFDDDRKYYRDVYFTSPQKGAPSITDDAYIPWYLDTQLHKPVALVPGALWEPLAFLLGEIDVDPDDWEKEKRQRGFRSGKQAYFFKMRAKEGMEDWLKRAKGIKGVKVNKAKVNKARKVNPQTGEPFVSSVMLDFDFMHPETGDRLLMFEMEVNFNGMFVEFLPNQGWKVADDLRYMRAALARKVARRYVQARRSKVADEAKVVNDLLEYVNTKPGSYMLSSLAMKGGDFEGTSVGDMQRAAEALQLQGLIGYDGGNMIQTKEHVRLAALRD